MFISPVTTRYSKDGNQVSTGKYVAFFSDVPMLEIWAYFPRKPIRLEQLGHWMMGKFRAFDREISVSGEAGHDGLPLDIKMIPQSVLSKPPRNLVRLPEDLAELYRKSEGHNTIGGAVTALRNWAKKVYAECYGKENTDHTQQQNDPPEKS